MKASTKGEEPTGTDAEACAYLMTASLTQPINRDWTEIYLYLTTKVFSKHKDCNVPEDIKVEYIIDYQMNELNRLKSWLYRQRVKARLEKDRAERRDRRQEKEARRETAQPAMFEF